MHKLKWALLALLCLIGSVSCTNQNMAPVVNAWAESKTQMGNYRVKPGDTLYSIAWSLGLDYRSLAKINHLEPPYAIHPGESLKTFNAFKQEKKILTRKPREIHIRMSTWPSPRWKWPAKGRLIHTFSYRPLGNKGIDIAGKLGEPIYAAANGVVVYSGAGVRGYGNLIIIKHNASFLSAYAFNKRLFVKVGQRIRRGQRIALMGRNNAGKVMLHFEIRKNGNPVNPKLYL